MMGMLYEPVVHRCPVPATYGVAYERGTWWQCDDCGTLWEFAFTEYGKDWVRRRSTKRRLRKIARLRGES